MTPIQTIKNFGDVMKITYDEKSSRMEAIGRLSPTDVTRLLDALTTYYSKRKAIRCKRIAELSAELSKLVLRDCSFYADTHALIAVGKTIVLDAERKVITG